MTPASHESDTDAAGPEKILVAGRVTGPGPAPGPGSLNQFKLPGRADSESP